VRPVCQLGFWVRSIGPLVAKGNIGVSRGWKGWRKFSRGILAGLVDELTDTSANGPLLTGGHGGHKQLELPLQEAEQVRLVVVDGARGGRRGQEQPLRAAPVRQRG
jgi:hypothetical protein